MDSRERLKERWKHSKGLFISQVLQLPITEFQADILNWEGVQYSGRTIQGVLAPRGSGKSEVGTIGDACHEMCHNKDLAGQIIAESLSTATTFLSAIKQNFERNDLLRSAYGDHVSDEWSATRITSAKRSVIRKEPTIQCLGAQGAIVGRHVDYQWCDDLVSLKNSATDDTRKKMRNWYDTALMPILDPGGVQKIRGTRYFQKDLYYSMMKAFGEEAFLIIPAIFRDPGYIDENAFPAGRIEKMGREGREIFYSSGNACIWPQTDEHSYWEPRWPLYTLQEIRKKDFVSFNTQYQNNTNVLKSELLNDDAIVVIPESKIPPLHQLICYQGVDPARKIDGSGSYFSITTIGVHKETGLIYILRQLDKKLADPVVMCDFIFSEFMWVIRNGGTVHGTGVEDNAFQGVLVNHINANPKKYGVIPFVRKTSLKDKFARFIDCSRWFNGGYVRFSAEVSQLIEDTAEFPDCDIKDRVDSLMHALETMKISGLQALGLDFDIRNLMNPTKDSAFIGFG